MHALQATPAASVHYQVEISDLHAHLYKVTLTITHPAAEQVLALPVWIPGSYLVREFSKHLQQLQCFQNQQEISARQTDKCSWTVACNTSQALQVSYQVYAFDTSVRTAWLSSERGFFNGTSLCLRAVGHDHLPHQLSISSNGAPEGWQLATALPALKTSESGFGLYGGDNYDMLVDCPVEMGHFWRGQFSACGIAHTFVVAGAPPSFDGAKLLEDTRAICETEIQFWHGAQASPSNAAAPFSHYLFLLNVVPDGYGGLEHRNSTALICGHKDLPRLDSPFDFAKPTTHEGYTTLLGLISHEYFHTWNVKRLRPAEFAQYDYTQENHTQLLWFFEGFTSYYDDLLLLRAKRIDTSTYLKLLAKTINQVQQTPGRLVQSVAQASFDAWVKYYRPDENTANATISYYTKGSMVALCLDLHLRASGISNLDAVMRALWQRCHGGPMTEQDLITVLEQLTGCAYASEIASWVHSTQELPVLQLLEQNGIEVQHDTPPLPQQLGLRVKEQNGVLVQQVLRHSTAEQAGFAAGDEWLAVQDASNPGTTAWRIYTLEDLHLYCSKSTPLQALICRNRRLHTLTLHPSASSKTVSLSVKDEARATRWLEGTILLLSTSPSV